MKTLHYIRHPHSLGAAIVALALAGQAGAASYRVTDASVVAHCTMTVGGGFEARSTALEGTVQYDDAESSTIEGQLELDLSAFDTGIGLRDRHLRENYLEVDRGAGFATATLGRIKLDLGDGARPDGEIPFAADLTFHGETRRLSGKVKASPEAGGFAVTATFDLLLPDFSIAKPRHMGVGVKDKIRLEVKFTLSPAMSTESGGAS